MLGEQERPRHGIPGGGIDDSYRELSRLIAAEIDALDREEPAFAATERTARRRMDRSLRRDHEAGTDPFAGEEPAASAAEDDFVELVAALLNRRPARGQLLQRLTALVLADHGVAPEPPPECPQNDSDGGEGLDQTSSAASQPRTLPPET